MDLKPSQSGVSNYTDEYDCDYDYDYDVQEEELNKNESGIIFLKGNELISNREKVIKEAMENLSLSREDSILALIFFSWSIEELQEKWFEDVENNRIKCGIALSEKDENKLKEEGIESFGDNCLICFEERNPSFDCLTCGHQFCGDCWKEYLVEKSKDFMISLTSPCPQKGCTCIVTENLFFKYLIDCPESLELFNKAILKNFTETSIDIKACPNPHCTISIKCFDHIAKDIECLCGKIFCWKCYRDTHRPCTCEMMEKWERKNKSENEDERWMKANTKTCPHCGQKIEKSYGCNYMLCDKRAGGCGKAFCYVCETDWEKHSQDHFNCNKYTAQIKDKEKKAKEINEDIKRTSFYFDRYMNYKNAVRSCVKELTPKIEEKIQLLIALKGFPLSEVEFLREAVKTLIRGKTYLKNTYVFGYFLKDDKTKDLFEFNQGLLERNADYLHMILEKDDTLNKIIENDAFNEWNPQFTQFKNRVLNLISVTEKYCKNLILAIETEYIQNINQKLLE